MILAPVRQIRVAVRAALDEDLAYGDITTDALFPEPTPARGVIVARHPLVLAGVAVARQVFAELEPTLRVTLHCQDGSRAVNGTAVLTVRGDARSILMGERVALNFLQHLSGIATLTASFCQALRGHRTRVLDTRKTIPGLRALEKWAVRLGGGRNHRYSLGDGILIKDNHVALLQSQPAPLAAACRLARERGPHGHRIIIEVQSVPQVSEALEGGADVILLDNMDPQSVRKAVELVKGRALVEVSGGITLDSAVEMARAGADAVSVGALTHSAPAANLSMELFPLRTRLTRRPRGSR